MIEYAKSLFIKNLFYKIKYFKKYKINKHFFFNSFCELTNIPFQFLQLNKTKSLSELFCKKIVKKKVGVNYLYLNFECTLFYRY